MSEIRVFTIATIILIVVGGLIPLMIGSVKDTSSVELTGLINTTYNMFSSGQDFTGGFETETGDSSLENYFVGLQIMYDEFPTMTYIFIFLYAFIFVYTIVKAFPFT